MSRPARISPRPQTADYCHGRSEYDPRCCGGSRTDVHREDRDGETPRPLPHDLPDETSPLPPGVRLTQRDDQTAFLALHDLDLMVG